MSVYTFSECKGECVATAVPSTLTHQSCDNHVKIARMKMAPSDPDFEIGPTGNLQF